MNEKNNDWSYSKMNKNISDLTNLTWTLKFFVNKTMIFINKLFSWEHCIFCFRLDIDKITKLNIFFIKFFFVLELSTKFCFEKQMKTFLNRKIVIE